MNHRNGLVETNVLHE